MDTCDRLRIAREEKGWSQQEFARRLGMSQQKYHPYEHGREMKTGMLVKVCAVLECSPNWLLGVKESGMHLEPDSLLLHQLKEAFNRLNEEGQQEAVKRVTELSELPRYTESGEKEAGTGTCA